MISGIEIFDCGILFNSLNNSRLSRKKVFSRVTRLCRVTSLLHHLDKYFVTMLFGFCLMPIIAGQLCGIRAVPTNQH